MTAPPGVFSNLRRGDPKLRRVIVDGGPAEPKLRDALVSLGRWTLQIIKRSDTATGFDVWPWRRVVERAFAWLGRGRRLARDMGLRLQGLARRACPVVKFVAIWPPASAARS